MSKRIPAATIQALARSVVKEAANYGFGQLDIVRLVNELMDYCTSLDDAGQRGGGKPQDLPDRGPTELPVTTERFIIRPFDEAADTAALEGWLPDKYGRHFLLSSTAAQSMSLEELVRGTRNHLGMITSLEGAPIGVLAFLDYDVEQKRAELRKLIGDPQYRGIGIAEEATRLWVGYGMNALDLEKIVVSTLQTHVANIKLNEKIGFQVEGLLRDEVLIDGKRHDVLRMGFCKS